jgi:hypothetical protein
MRIPHCEAAVRPLKISQSIPAAEFSGLPAGIQFEPG